MCVCVCVREIRCKSSGFCYSQLSDGQGKGESGQIIYYFNLAGQHIYTQRYRNTHTQLYTTHTTTHKQIEQNTHNNIPHTHTPTHTHTHTNTHTPHTHTRTYTHTHKDLGQFQT